MPTLPLHQGWLLSQSMMSNPSFCSCGAYPSSSRPSDPRATQINAPHSVAVPGEPPMHHLVAPGHSIAFAYGTNSRMAGTGFASATSGSQIRVARRTPSGIGHRDPAVLDLAECTWKRVAVKVMLRFREFWGRDKGLAAVDPHSCGFRGKLRTRLCRCRRKPSWLHPVVRVSG